MVSDTVTARIGHSKKNGKMKRELSAAMARNGSIDHALKKAIDVKRIRSAVTFH
jgi:hypothetical protein